MMHDDDDPKMQLDALEKGQLSSVNDVEAAKHHAQANARAYLRDRVRINLLLPRADIQMIQRLAVQKGLPYQPLIASVLHQYTTG